MAQGERTRWRRRSGSVGLNTRVHVGPEASQRQVEQMDGFRCTYGRSRYCFQVVCVGGN